VQDRLPVHHDPRESGAERELENPRGILPDRIAGPLLAVPGRIRNEYRPGDPAHGEDACPGQPGGMSSLASIRAGRTTYPSALLRTSPAEGLCRSENGDLSRPDFLIEG